MSEKTTLPDGRTAKQDKNGRWRSEAGTFIPNPQRQGAKPNKFCKPLAPNPAAKRIQDQHKQTFLEFFTQTAQKKGHPVTTPQEAFGAVIAVQTEIALDPNNGAKATSAAHFIIKTTGILDTPDPDDQPETERWVLGKEIAVEFLQAIEEEKESRQLAEESE